MENSKADSNSNDASENAATVNLENPSSNSAPITASVPVVTEDEQGSIAQNNDQNQTADDRPSSRRTPFSDLSQVDADLALARTLQEQERAYMMLTMSSNGIGYGRWETGSYEYDHDHEDEDEEEDDFDDIHEEHYDGSDFEDNEEEEEEEEEEDAFDVHAHAEEGEDEDREVELDPSDFSSDEAYARALQGAEEREMAARLLALTGINAMYVGEAQREEVHGGNSQDTWEEVDPDELSYEELLALGEVVGTESRGLSADTINSLPSIKYKSKNLDGSTDTCVICRLEYEDGDTLTALSCKHSYHPDCINNWLKINKVCPICSAEVSTSGNS